MHNMVCVGIDFEKALLLDKLSTCTDSAAPAPTRMRYIHNAAKRTEYGNIIEEGIVAADVAAKVAAANDMLARLRRAQATADLHNNKPLDANEPSLWLRDGSGLIDPVSGRTHNDMGLGAHSEKTSSEVECIQAEILLVIDDAVASVSTVVSTEREKRASRTSGNRRD